MTDPTHEAQTAAEGVEVIGVPETVTLLGQEFRVSTATGYWAWVKYANAAHKGADHTDMDGLAAMYSIVQSCIHPDDWPRFERHALAMDAGPDDMWKVVDEACAAKNKALELEAARPTQRPSDSSDGPQPTPAPSKAISSPPASMPAPATAPDPGEWAEVVSIDDLMKGRTGPVRLTG